MMDERFAIPEALAAQLRDRLFELVVAVDPDETPAVIASEVTGLEPSVADELFDHEDTLHLNADELDLICNALDLNPLLVRLIVVPTSIEVLRHALTTVIEEVIRADRQCAICCELDEHFGALDLTDQASVESFIIALTEHLADSSVELEIEMGLRLEQLVDAFGALSEPAQLRVLAAAYEERERELLGMAESPLVRLGRFRSEYLDEVLRAQLDTLALADGPLTLAELAHASGRSPRSLRRLLGRIEKAMGRFTANHPELSLRVPVQLFSGRPQRVGMLSEYLPAWRGLARAERESQLRP